MDVQERMRALPSVEALAQRVRPLAGAVPGALLISEARAAVSAARENLLRCPESSAPEDLVAAVLASLRELTEPSLRRVINATGVILHTNLGRAPLAAGESSGGYSNLEFHLATGERGKRDAHLTALFQRLLDRPAVVVNNNAAAYLLVLNELVRGGEVIISRGELVEIGDGFRIPDILRSAGAVLREVGTTNKTRIADYREAISDRTALILRVHPSNFRMTGFTERVPLEDLAALAKERMLPLYENLGSGCVVDLRPFGIEEPRVQESLRAGVDLVSFSGDKLLGGPQAGILAGRADLIARLRRNPLYRALRCDKLVFGALERTLRSVVLERWEELPAIRMIRASADDVRDRALAIASAFNAPGVAVIPGRSVIGGGSTPEQSIPTWLVAVESGESARNSALLRTNTPPVVTRLEEGRLLIDPRTVFPEEEGALIVALQARSW